MDSAATPQDAPRVVDVPARPTAVVRGSVPVTELRDFFDRSFRRLGEAIAQGVVSPSGPALAVYSSPPGDVAELEVGFPVAAPVDPAGDVLPGTLPSGRAVTCTHRGGYDGLDRSYERLQAWASEQGIALGGPLWESYVTEPSPEADPADMVTELYWAVADGPGTTGI